MVFAVWLLGGIASAAGHAFEAARRGIPEGQRGGATLAPLVPVVPLAFWGAALLADFAVGPWGTVVVGWLHAALGVVFAGTIARNWRRLRTLAKQAEPGPTPDASRM